MTDGTEHQSGSRSFKQTRTSGSGGRSCRVCGAPITGRRRNGFCSDRCRLRSDRTAKRKRVERALASLEHKVAGFAVEMRSELESLRADLLGGDRREMLDRDSGAVSGDEAGLGTD